VLAAINDNHVLTVKSGDFRVKIWTSFLWVPMINDLLLER
jgi:hypothetical protein